MSEFCTNFCAYLPSIMTINSTESTHKYSIFNYNMLTTIKLFEYTLTIFLENNLYISLFFKSTYFSKKYT